MRRIVLTHGTLAGLVMSAMLVAVLPFREQIGFERGALVGYASMVAAFLLVHFGVRAYRDQVGGGLVSFGRALGVGALIALVASVCYVVTWQIVYFGFLPDFMAEVQAYSLERMRAGGATAAELAAERAEMARFAARYRNPAFNAAVTLLEPLPVGLLVALVSAAVLRRPRRAAAPLARPA
jgi:hypothetical protein